MKSDAMWVGTESEAVAGMAATESEVTRLRLMLEGSRAFVGRRRRDAHPELRSWVSGWTAGTPRPGSARRSAPAWAWSDPERGLSAEVKARGLLTHEDSGFGERGVSGGSDLGPAARLGRAGRR